MDVTTQSSDLLIKLERVLSKERIDSYKQIGGTDQVALCRYLWNSALCESLYPGFQILEVGFRNAVHIEIGKHAKDPNWLTKTTSSPTFLHDDEKEAVEKALTSLQKRRGQTTEGYLVAEMSFGFWTSLLDVRYDKMWPKIIGEVFPNMPRTIRTRSEVSRLMNPVRKLRNAALHHHSIWHWKDLNQQHEQIHLLISYLCKHLHEIAKQTDRFSKIYSGGPQQFSRIASELSK